MFRQHGYRAAGGSPIEDPIKAQMARTPLRPSTRQRRDQSVDVAQGIERAGGKPDLAEELFSMLLEQLIQDRRELPALMDAGNREELLERVHKLHGATRYCGVPELRGAAEQLETALKQDKDDVRVLFDQFLAAIDRIQHWCEHSNWQALFREEARIKNQVR